MCQIRLVCSVDAAGQVFTCVALAMPDQAVYPDELSISHACCFVMASAPAVLRGGAADTDLLVLRSKLAVALALSHVTPKIARCMPQVAVRAVSSSGSLGQWRDSVKNSMVSRKNQSQADTSLCLSSNV